MPFDRTNNAHLLQLKAEAAAQAPGETATRVILAILNDPDNNPGSETVAVPLPRTTIEDVASAIDSTEYDALTAYDKEWVKMLINRPPDEQIRSHTQKLNQLFGAGSATRTAITAVRTRKASNAEKLFGVDVVISRKDWIAAREAT